MTSVRINEGPDGYFYLDVRRPGDRIFKTDSRHATLEAVLERIKGILPGQCNSNQE